MLDLGFRTPKANSFDVNHATIELSITCTQLTFSFLAGGLAKNDASPS